MEQSQTAWQLQNAKIRGLNTSWIDAGPKDADIVLFLHGYPDTAECWEHQIEALAGSYRVIAPFMRGVSGSEPGDSMHRYGTVAVNLDLLELLKLVDPTHKRRIFCVGHDLGSVYAWNLTAALADRTAGLVIINGLSIGQMLKRWKNPGQLRKSWYMYLMQVPLLPEALVRVIPGRLMKFAHSLGDLEEDKRPHYRAKGKRNPLYFPINQYRSFFREIPRHLINPVTRVSCPVLVLWGAKDAFLMPPRMDELKADADDVTVRILDGGHWLQRQEAEKVNALLAKFFEDSYAKRQFAAKKRVKDHVATSR